MLEYLQDQLNRVNEVINWLKTQPKVSKEDLKFWNKKNLEIRIKIEQLKRQ